MRGTHCRSAPRSRRLTRPPSRPHGDSRTSRCSASSISARPTGVNSYGLIRALCRGARRPAADLRARRPSDQPVGRGRRPSAHGLRRRGRRHPRRRRGRPRGRRCRYRPALRLAGGPRRGLPPSGRPQPAPAPHSEPGGHPAGAGAQPAAGHRPRRGHRDGDALGRAIGGPGLERVGLPRLSRPRRRGRASRVARGGRGAMAAADRAARRRTRAGRPVHRRAPRLPRSVSRPDRPLLGARSGHERAARRWRRAGRIRPATVAAVVVPVWMRTLDEIRAPFAAGDGQIAGLELESAELFRLDNPYWDDNPAVFARSYVQSVSAWGGPLLLRSFALEGEDRAPGLVVDFLRELEEHVAEAPDRSAGTTSRPSSSAARSLPSSPKNSRPAGGRARAGPAHRRCLRLGGDRLER